MSKVQQIAQIVKAAKGAAVSYKEIAEQMQVSLQSVTGSVAALKKDPSFAFEQGAVRVVVAEKAKKQRENTKQSIATSILDAHFSNQSPVARHVLIEQLMTGAKLTKNGANTYIQNYKIKHGLIGKK